MKIVEAFYNKSLRLPSLIDWSAKTDEGLLLEQLSLSFFQSLLRLQLHEIRVVPR